MSPYNPEDWPRLFEQHLNAGDLNAVISLYEPGARFVAQSGNIVTGRDQIRLALAAMISSETRLHSQVIRAVTVGDVALLYTNFEGTTLAASGKTVEIHSRAIEILRRQSDGIWRLIVGDPNGRNT
jgi:uncharacterized protein (TIGR02246 family)